MRTQLIRRWLLGVGVSIGAAYWTGCEDAAARPRHLSDTSAEAPVTAAVAPEPDPAIRGWALFAKHCAPCHGESGRGDGEFAPMLNPGARDFAKGNFKVTSTATGLPSDEDLLKTLRRGMLPSLMPPRANWPESDLRAVISVVRELALAGQVADQLAEDPDRSRGDALKRAHAALDPGPAVTLPPKPPAIFLERGRNFFLANCAVCHDADGTGRTRTDLVDNDENPISPRDFTAGYFKGGSSLEELATRIFRGMPGTPMPSHPDISGDDLWSVAAYVRTFIPPPERMPALPPCPTPK